MHTLPVSCQLLCLAQCVDFWWPIGCKAVEIVGGHRELVRFRSATPKKGRPSMSLKQASTLIRVSQSALVIARRHQLKTVLSVQKTLSKRNHLAAFKVGLTGSIGLDELRKDKAVFVARPNKSTGPHNHAICIDTAREMIFDPQLHYVMALSQDALSAICGQDCTGIFESIRIEQL